MIDPNAHDTVKYAAEELQYWIKEISGATLPIVDSPAKKKIKINLAVNPAEFGDDLKKLQDSDGYAVRTRDNMITILAGRPRGVKNGVYRFLFRNTDIIWATPDKVEGTFFTPCPTLEINHSNYIDIPALKERGLQFAYDIQKDPPGVSPSDDWQLRNGCNGSLMAAHFPNADRNYKPEYAKYDLDATGMSGHALGWLLLNPRKWGKDHPEFWAQINGKRTPNQFTAPCFTSEEMYRTVEKEFDELAAILPAHVKSYTVGLADTFITPCECEKCREPITLESGKVLTSQDDDFVKTRFFLFLNKLAKHAQKKYPGKKITALAYMSTEKAPELKLEPNIRICYCPIFRNFKYPVSDARKNKVSAERISSWIGKIPEETPLAIHEYYGLVGSFPSPRDVAALADMKYYKSVFPFGGFANTEFVPWSGTAGKPAVWDQNMMYFWVVVNSMWEMPDGVDSLRGEFLKRVFGSAAADMKEYFAIIEKKWRDSPGRSDYADDGMADFNQFVRIPGIANECRAILNRALAKASSEKARNAIRRIADGMEKNLKAAEDLQLTAIRTAAPVVFDPDFASGDWGKPPVYDKFLDNDGNNTADSKEKTRIRFLYDDTNLYIGVEMLYRKPPTTMPEKLVRDTLRTAVGVVRIVTTAPDRKRRLYFSYDPAKNILDSAQDAPWDKWTAEGTEIESRYTARGWSSMVKIPFATIDYRDKTKALPISVQANRFKHITSLNGSAMHKPYSFSELIMK